LGSKKYNTTIHAGGLELPVDVTVEWRRDTRFSITGKRISIRLPVGISPDATRKHLGDLQNWVHEQFAQKPVLREAFAGKDWKTGDVLTVGARRYVLDVREEIRGTHTARLIGDTIYILLAEAAGTVNRAKSIKTLLSRVVASDFYPEITRRVLDMNDRTFRQHVKSVNLKYNHTNWGSCSAHNNVNLSTRLLFAPPAVQDYVILHELAHLVELNHSERFWALVEKHMPDYLEKEAWLKVNRAKCDF
jgi:predicted metal-dependent hydrolase